MDLRKAGAFAFFRSLTSFWSLPPLADTSASETALDSRLRICQKRAPDMATETPVAARPRVTRLTFGELWQVPVLLLGSLALLGVALVRPYWYDPELFALRREMAAAREALARKSPIASELATRLTNVLPNIHRAPERAGEAHFLLGSVYVRLAEQASGTAVAENWQHAREELGRALQTGVSASDSPCLLYRLAKTLSQTNGNTREVAGYLERSIDDGAEDRSEGYELLTQAYLLENPPDFEAARKANETLLQLPNVYESRLAKAQLVKGQLLLRLNDLPNARKALQRLGSTAPPSILAQAQYLLALSYQQAGEWEQARPLWEKLTHRPARAGSNIGHIYYYLGVADWNVKRAAEAIRAWQEAGKHSGEEAQAATLRLAAALAEAGQLPRALELYQQALQQINRPEEYCNDLVPLAELRASLQADVERAVKSKQFPIAQALAHMYQHLSAPVEGHALAGQVALAWAAATREQAAHAATPAESSSHRQEAARHFHDAGDAFVAAATKAEGGERIHNLWRAADAYDQAAAYDQAGANEDSVSVLLQLTGSGNRTGEAWYRLGRAYQALHEEDYAKQAYGRCIARDTKPYVFRARYQLAMLELQINPDDPDKQVSVEKQLKQNLYLMSLDPDPEAHEKSLFAHADVLYRLGPRDNFQQAAHVYEQALHAYPNHPGALRAQYQLGKCYLSQAQSDLPVVHGRDPQLREAQNQIRRQRDQAVQNAVHVFEGLRATLEKPAAAGAPASDPALLRDTLFALAECSFVGEKYADAIGIDQKIAHDYAGTLDEVLALKHTCESQIQLTQSDAKQLDKAYDTWRAIGDKLQRLPDSVFGGRPENQSRQALKTWLQAMQKSLDDVRVNDTGRSN
jgi:tetratricopeptide (TPR) repeat protein